MKTPGRRRSLGYLLSSTVNQVRARLRPCRLPIVAGPTYGHGSGADEEIILVYNRMWRQRIPIDRIELPKGMTLIQDRRRFAEAHAVIFHLPQLQPHDFAQLKKSPGQIWVAWYLESDAIYGCQRSAKFMAQFDLTMSYRQDADIFIPYTTYFGAGSLDRLRRAPKPKTNDKIAVFVASNCREYIGRNHYVSELMRHLPVHSYGKCLNNRPWPEDQGDRDSKHRLLADYKFTLAFENSRSPDYITEKFFDGLLVGSVPVFMGSSNVADYAPGEHSYIDSADFRGPRQLAEYLRRLCNDHQAYEAYLTWKSSPFLPAFEKLLARADTEPFTRLARKIRDMQKA
jgi:hypothetical protein